LFGLRLVFAQMWGGSRTALRSPTPHLMRVRGKTISIAGSAEADRVAILFRLSALVRETARAAIRRRPCIRI
jgi:hypothetical protein